MTQTLIAIASAAGGFAVGVAFVWWLVAGWRDESTARRVAEVQATERGGDLAARDVTIAGLRIKIAAYENAGRAREEIADAHEATDPAGPARANAGADSLSSAVAFGHALGEPHAGPDRSAAPVVPAGRQPTPGSNPGR